ncbi:MAG: diguanylate cyclase [Campylobacterota bacterium]
MTIQKIIKSSIKALQEKNEALTPQNYTEAFCREAKKQGVVIEDCNKVDKFIKKLAPKYQKELYRRNIHTLDELFTFLTMLLNRLDKEESAAVIKAYTLLIRRVVQAATLHKDARLQEIATQSLQTLDPHMKLSEIEDLRVKWNDYVMEYDDSFLEPLQKYVPIKKMEYKQVCQTLLEALRDKPEAMEGFDALAEVVVAALSPSVASSANDTLATFSQQLLKNPKSLTTRGVIEDIRSMVKLRISLDKAQIASQVTKLNDIIETLSVKLNLLSKTGDKNSSDIQGLKTQLQEVDLQDQNFENIHGKLSTIVNSLEEEATIFYNDIKEKEEEVHNLKNRVQLLEKALKKEQMRSNTDKLTGLPNKRAYDNKIEELEAEFKRYGKDYSIVLFDIDKFKHINDTYGHDAGDIILSSIAKIFIKLKRETDTIARFGGEEFVALLPFTTAQNAAIFAGKLKDAVQNSKFMYRGSPIPVTMSGGVANRSDVTDPNQLFKKADNLLYKAKNSGRNNIQQ